MTTPGGLRSALRERRVWIVIMALLGAMTAMTSGLLWAIGAWALAGVSMLAGTWIVRRRGGVPLVNRRQAVAVGLTMGLVLTVAAVSLT